MSGYDPQDFESVITYMRREFGAETFRNPSRMFAIFCDLSPKLKPYGAVARRLSERGILSGLEAASADGDTREQARMMMKARDVLENELLLGADRVEYFLRVFGGLYGVEGPRPVATSQAAAGAIPASQASPAVQMIPMSQIIPGAQTFPNARTVPTAQTPPGIQMIPITQIVPAAGTGSQSRILPMSGKSGGLTWNLDSGGCLTISGRGDMEDFTNRAYRKSTAPWSDCQSEILSALIKDGVTGIGQEAFSYCASLQSVRISASVTKIGYMAFRGCAALRRILIPHSVREIRSSAFQECVRLKSVAIPRGVEIIEPHAFEECRSLTSVTIPNSVRRISYRAFWGCTGLIKAYVPVGADIDPDAFDFHTTVVQW